MMEVLCFHTPVYDERPPLPFGRPAAASITGFPNQRLPRCTPRGGRNRFWSKKCPF